MPCRMTAEERRLEVFETPPHYVEPLLRLIGPLHGLSVYEPCVGQGHIARYLTDAAKLVTNDINPDCPATMHQDARCADAWPILPSEDRSWKLDWTITNPPFNSMLPILVRALRCSKNVAFLARLSFLEPTKSRTAFWLAYPPSDVLVLPRYSFRLNDQGKRQTDNVTCCWLVWREQPAMQSIRFSAQRQFQLALPIPEDTVISAR